MAKDTTNPWAKEADRNIRTESDIKDMKFEDDKTHNIRVLPQKDETAMPFYGYCQHWIPQAGSKTGRPITHEFNKKCVVCEEISELWNEIHRLKDEEGLPETSPQVKSVYAEIEPIRARKKYDMNILDRDDLIDEKTGKKKVKRLCAIQSIWKPVFEYAKKWGSPSNSETGYDFEITTEGSGIKKSYAVLPNRNSSPLTSDEKALIDEIYDLAKLRKSSTPEEIIEVLEGAKDPFQRILKRMDERDIEKAASKRDVPEEEKREKPAVVSKHEEEEEEEEEEEVAASKEKVDDTKPGVEEEKEDSDGDDDNIDEYDCRGQLDEEDLGCKDCPVKEDCRSFQPFYKKAIKLGLPTSSEKKVEQIIESVKAAQKEEEPEEKPEGTLLRRRKQKKIPF